MQAKGLQAKPLHVNGTYGINMAILYDHGKHTRSWTTKPEGEEREESRALNQYWMEDAEVVSTCVMGIEMVRFGAQCISEIHQDVDIKYQAEINWSKGTK